MTVSTQNTAKLDEILKNGLTPDIKDVMGQAIKEVTDEENLQKVERCKELVKKARALQNEMNAAERQFLGQKKKFDKQLGKLMKQITGMMSGKPVSEDDDDDEEAAEDGT